MGGTSWEEWAGLFSVSRSGLVFFRQGCAEFFDRGFPIQDDRRRVWVWMVLMPENSLPQSAGGADLGVMDLNQRSRDIFKQIVESYLSSGEPVGSRHLSRLLTTRNIFLDVFLRRDESSVSWGVIPTDPSVTKNMISASLIPAWSCFKISSVMSS